MKNPNLTRNDVEYVVKRIDRIVNLEQKPNIIHLETFKFKKDAINFLKAKELKYISLFDFYQCDKNSVYVYFISKMFKPT